MRFALDPVSKEVRLATRRERKLAEQMDAIARHKEIWEEKLSPHWKDRIRHGDPVDVALEIDAWLAQRGQFEQGGLPMRLPATDEQRRAVYDVNAYLRVVRADVLNAGRPDHERVPMAEDDLKRAEVVSRRMAVRLGEDPDQWIERLKGGA